MKDDGTIYLRKYILTQRRLVLSLLVITLRPTFYNTYFFDHDVDGVFLLEGRGAGVGSGVIDSGMIDGKSVLKGRVPARCACPTLMRTRREREE